MNDKIKDILYPLSFLDFRKLATDQLELIYQIIFNELDFDTATSLANNLFSSDFISSVSLDKNSKLTYRSLEFLIRKKYLYRDLKSFTASSTVLSFGEFIFECYRSFDSGVKFKNESTKKIKDLSTNEDLYIGKEIILNRGYKLFTAKLTAANLIYLSSLAIDLRTAYISNDSIFAITYKSKIPKLFKSQEPEINVTSNYTVLNLININHYKISKTNKKQKPKKYDDLHLDELPPHTTNQLKLYIQSKGYSLMDYKKILHSNNCSLLYDKNTKTYKGLNYRSIV